LLQFIPVFSNFQTINKNLIFISIDSIIKSNSMIISSYSQSLTHIIVSLYTHYKFISNIYFKPNTKTIKHRFVPILSNRYKCYNFIDKLFSIYMLCKASLCCCGQRIWYRIELELTFFINYVSMSSQNLFSLSLSLSLLNETKFVVNWHLYYDRISSI
jgi:hypothetical protein